MHYIVVFIWAAFMAYCFEQWWEHRNGEGHRGHSRARDRAEEFHKIYRC